MILKNNRIILPVIIILMTTFSAFAQNSEQSKNVLQNLTIEQKAMLKEQQLFIDKSKKIVDVRRGVLHPYNEEFNISYNLNYNAFLNGISLLKNLSTQVKDGLAAKQ